ncbi:alpha/beta hydrolase [Edaphobacter albus]|uniref:alpha/beta hydrolase n=1 Tax=Edaphobacter sp. 4G125 TaxID=2763071 RepID=UPI0016451052|nr:alpha/beta hydrolase [Edaphobacter sp. 4G125]QNI37191.1 alpha/beta hydrolase [Edaphobacter sp. 4G125]
MRKNLLVACVLFASGVLHAQNVWQPSPGHTQIPIWSGSIPDAQPATTPETMKITGPESFVAGKPWTSVEHVALPTMTVYSPKGKNTGAAIIVFPGGGYEILAIDLEGSEVCDWLTTKGITCVLLKYRVPAPTSVPEWKTWRQSSIALEDAQRTISLVRSRASEWNIDPHKIGVLGFSAGGHLVTATSVHFDKRIYKEVDAVDKVSCRPDFAVALYPGHLHAKKGTIELNPDIANHITAQTPPTFLLQNENDNIDSIWDAVSYYAALLKANVPVEFHSYAEGGHAFGLRRTKYPATTWPTLVETWLHTIHILQ